MALAAKTAAPMLIIGLPLSMSSSCSSSGSSTGASVTSIPGEVALSIASASVCPYPKQGESGKQNSQNPAASLHMAACPVQFPVTWSRRTQASKKQGLVSSTTNGSSSNETRAIIYDDEEAVSVCSTLSSALGVLHSTSGGYLLVRSVWRGRTKTSGSVSFVGNR